MIYRRWAEKSFGKSIMYNKMNVLWAPRGAGKTTLVKNVCARKFENFHYFDMENTKHGDFNFKQQNTIIVYDHCDELFTDINHPFDEKIKYILPTITNNSPIKILFVVDNFFISDYFSHNIIFGRSKPRYSLPHINRNYFKWSKADLNDLGRLENPEIENLSYMTGIPGFHLKALTGKYSSFQELEIEAKQISSLWLQEHELEERFKSPIWKHEHCNRYKHKSRHFSVIMPPIMLF